MQKSRRLAIALASLSIGILLLPLVVGAANLMSNAHLEPPFDPYNGAGTAKSCGNQIWDTEVAHSWNGFEIISTSKLRFFSASDWGTLAQCLYNLSQAYTESRGGDAQAWVSNKKFDAGIYQQVPGVNIGAVYGFSAGIVQAFYTTSRTDPATGKMLRSVGIDPYGGTDPTGPNVIWSPEEPHAAFGDPGSGKKYTWFYPSVGATAMSTTVTVFVRVRSIEDVTDGISINQVWVDDTFMDVAPVTTLTLAPTGANEILATWSGSPASEFHLFAYEAQYRKATDPTWTDLQIFDVLTSPSLNDHTTIPVEPGVEYVVRARTWHEQDASSSYEVAGPWTEQRFTGGGVVQGAVLTNREDGIAGATVAVSGTMTTTTSVGGGVYSLLTGAGTFGITATVSSGWSAPQPIWVTVPATNTAALTITLRPPDDFIGNGDFEGTLDGWAHTLPAPTANLVAGGHRSGDYSLCISQTATLTASAVVSEVYRPVLSFWYRVDGSDGNDTLTAGIFGPDTFTTTLPLSFTQNTAGWQHAYLPLTLQRSPTSGTGNFGGGAGTFLLPQDDVYSGDLGVRFAVQENGGGSTVFCLDEVSAGGSWGGPNKVFLPLVFKSSTGS